MTFKPAICLDFDGVLHWYRPERCVRKYSDDDIQDAPVPGAREAVEELRKTYRVVVYSSRCRSLAGRRAIQFWLHEYGIETDGVVDSKPQAVMYVDDRGIRFDGDWAETLREIAGFSNWLRGSV